MYVYVCVCHILRLQPQIAFYHCLLVSLSLICSIRRCMWSIRHCCVRVAYIGSPRSPRTFYGRCNIERTCFVAGAGLGEAMVMYTMCFCCVSLRTLLEMYHDTISLCVCVVGSKCYVLDHIVFCCRALSMHLHYI